MDFFDSWTLFQRMSLFAGIAVLYGVALTIAAVWIASRQNARYNAEQDRKQRRKRARKERR